MIMLRNQKVDRVHVSFDNVMHLFMIALCGLILPFSGSCITRSSLVILENYTIH